MARTVTIQPIKTSRFDNGPASPTSPSSPGLDPIHEDDFFAEIPTRHSSISQASVIQSPTLKSSESFPPVALNSPRRFSSGSSATSSTMLSRESIRSEMARSSSWSSKTSFDSFESSQWKPGDPRQKRTSPSTRQRSFSQPNELFAALPAEVLEVILGMLKQSHIGRGSSSCATCWMRDLSNISLCSRKWNAFARVALYEDIQLIGADSAAHKKRFKQLHGARLLLLRQTLRVNPRLASLVRSLKVPRPDTTLKGMNSKILEQYDDLIATIVMACPNLESLRGPMFGYDGSFKKIFHALSTRKQLKEMDWLVEPSIFQKQQRGTQGSVTRNSNDSSLPPKLERLQERTFLDHFRNWSKLNSLSVHCLPGATLAPDNLLTKSFRMLPSLQNLHLCSVPPNVFNDTTLLLLPPVETLSLTHITGITSNGISAFATCASSQPLRKLYLHHTPMTSLPALARILSNLPKLSIFSLAQAFPPLMPEADSFMLWMMPYLASTSVTKLHWDITSDSDCANSADDILARSIQTGGFPQLRLLRTPNDPEGIFQDLCRPVERIDLPTDRFNIAEAPLSPIEATVPTSPPRYLQKPPMSPKSPPLPSPTEASNRTAFCTDLRAARLAAQSRLEKAETKPRFNVFVMDEDGSMVDRFGLAGFIGTLGSNIRYHLLPDAGSMDKKGGMVDPRDLAGDAGEDLANGKEGCTGTWNQREGVIADKKEKEKWWHTERGRWTRVEMPS
ncbi:unnamed protein product [Clonostachys byssicola]|uniref:F-box domain-containing protein n=1 Tax=Clonostachys byssicola TaxID=160290 RepID=A0A9N9TWD2_9HYPO|nr:unnamed protein product [Clonostachys byssicola]